MPERVFAIIWVQTSSGLFGCAGNKPLAKLVYRNSSAALAFRILGLVRYQLGNPSRFPLFLADFFYGVEIIHRNSIRDVMCRILHIGGIV